MGAFAEKLAAIHRGRRWIVALEVAAPAAGFIATLGEWGAAGVMVVAAGRGVGDLADCPIHYVETESAESIIGRIRRVEEAFADPPPDVAQAVGRFDPEGNALVVTAPFSSATRLLGRRVYGARRPEWLALEDKTRADDLWDAAGIPRAPSRVVPVAEAPAVAAELAGRLGTVWTADNTEGWHGGADYTRWVADRTAVAEAVEWFSLHAQAVRVMPFLDGIPCSVHGFVTDRGVAVFRPVEIVILRRSDRRGFLYGGVATFWDPPDELREEMRSAARRVAAVLEDQVGYRGPFGIDGVATADGFRPTELNPRMSAGLGVQAAGTDLPLGSTTRAVVEGDLDVDPDWLEETVVAGADATRSGGMGVPLAGEVEPAETDVVFSPDGEAVPTDADPDGTLEVGPSGAGGSYLRLRLDPEKVEPGPSVAPKAVAACRLAARLWGIDLADLEPAPDLTK